MQSDELNNLDKLKNVQKLENEYHFQKNRKNFLL